MDKLDYIGIKEINPSGSSEKYSIQVNEDDFYQDTPNFIANGLVSRNSKHACIRQNQKVLTNIGYIEINRLKKPTKIAYLNKKIEICLTKRYNIHKIGERIIYRLET